MKSTVNENPYRSPESSPEQLQESARLELPGLLASIVSVVLLGVSGALVTSAAILFAMIVGGVPLPRALESAAPMLCILGTASSVVMTLFTMWVRRISSIQRTVSE